MRGYFQRRYSPGNIVLAGAGRIDFAALGRRRPSAAAAAWQPLPAGRTCRRPSRSEAFQVIHKESATQQYAVQLTGGPNAEDLDRYPAKLLATVLGDDTGSRLYWELVDSGLAEQASLYHHEYEGAGLFLTYMSCDPDERPRISSGSPTSIARPRSEGITPDELAQAKSKVASRVVLSGERPRGRLFALGGDWVQRREYRSVRDDLEAVSAITVEQVLSVLRRYPLTRSTTVTIGPLEKVRAPE